MKEKIQIRSDHGRGSLQQCLAPDLVHRLHGSRFGPRTPHLFAQDRAGRSFSQGQSRDTRRTGSRPSRLQDYRGGKKPCLAPMP